MSEFLYFSYVRITDRLQNGQDTFIVQRICDTWKDDIAQTVGPVLVDGVTTLPIVEGHIAIHQIMFHDVGFSPGETSSTFAIPYIGLEFHQ
ncbi:MAG: hypothetical protein JJ975_09730 [Bacteroidia bacterium]|nr:hypothetical protein [Bacteroidia bacterium]